MVTEPRLIARSCTTATTFSSAPVGACLGPSPQYSLTDVDVSPGLRIAATQRPTFHCAPISCTAVWSTASALLCRYSFRVISATRVRLLTSDTSDCFFFQAEDGIRDA